VSGCDSGTIAKGRDCLNDVSLPDPIRDASKSRPSARGGLAHTLSECPQSDSLNGDGSDTLEPRQLERFQHTLRTSAESAGDVKRSIAEEAVRIQPLHTMVTIALLNRHLWLESQPNREILPQQLPSHVPRERQQRKSATWRGPRGCASGQDAASGIEDYRSASKAGKT
jgi:hypothetical protein